MSTGDVLYCCVAVLVLANPLGIRVVPEHNPSPPFRFRKVLPPPIAVLPNETTLTYSYRKASMHPLRGRARPAATGALCPRERETIQREPDALSGTEAPASATRTRRVGAGICHKEVAGRHQHLPPGSVAHPLCHEWPTSYARRLWRRSRRS